MAGQAKAENGLNEQQQLFVDYYLASPDLNATLAAIKAKYSPRTARQQASRLLSNVNIQNAIAEAQEARSERIEITQDAVLNMWWQIANADPNELTQLRRLNCRYCWGVDHNYQWTPKEYERACEKAIANDEPEPLNVGGTDYDRNKVPNPDCPECSGHGIEHVYFADTTKLSPQAKLLYQGVKESKTGIEVMMADRMKALDNVARHLGMFKEQIDLKTEGNISIDIAFD